MRHESGDPAALAYTALAVLSDGDPETLLLAAEAVRQRIPELVAHHACQVASQSSWTRVAALLGIPRQTAHKRFARHCGQADST